MAANAGPGMHTVTIVIAQQMVQRIIPTLERRVDEAISEKAESVDLTMSAVQIVDSAALNWMLQAQLRLESLGIRFRLMEPSAVMLDVLLATRLDSRLTVEVAAGTGETAQGVADGR